MDIELVLRIAGIGILVAVICQLLKQTGRDDIAMLAALAALVLALGMVVGEIGELLEQVKRIFGIRASNKVGCSLLPHNRIAPIAACQMDKLHLTQISP